MPGLAGTFLSAMSSRHTSNYYSSSKSDWQEEGSVEGTEENEEQETDVESTSPLHFVIKQNKINSQLYYRSGNVWKNSSKVK